MKKIVSGFCGVLLALQVTAQSNSPIATFSKKDLTMKEIVESLQRKEKLAVMYDVSAINPNAVVHLPSQKLSLDQLMKVLGDQTGLDVKLVNNSLYIKKKEQAAPVAAAQQQEKIKVSGIVKSKDDNSTVPGASITADGKVVGVSGPDGSFSVNVLKGATLEFKAIGLNPTKYQVTGAQNDVSISLSTNVTQLNSVVVTALGIKRDEKALGYAVTKMGTEDFTDAVSNNWTNSLSGKVAGVNITRSGAGPAGSNKIVLRGVNSLSGTSEALIVVDGVILNGGSGRSTGTGSGSYLDAESPTDFGNSINDLNPEDFENVTILKGPGASALYGARGANGAIIITTKNGKNYKKGLGVTVNSNAALDMINRWPDYQYEYGQGATGQDGWYSYGATEDGASTRSTSSAWGPKFDGQSYYQYDPTTRTAGTSRTPWVPYKNNRKDFFETGQTYTNTVTVEGSSEKTSSRISFTNLNNTWIVPNTGYKRTTVALSVNHKISDKLQIATKVNYANKKSDNLPSVGYNNQTIMYFIRGMVPNANIDWFRDYWVPGKEQQEQTRPFSSLLDNPFLQAYEMLNSMNRHGVVGNVSATYNFTKNFSLLVRTSLDFASESRAQQRPKGTQKFVDGMYRTQNINNRESNSDFLFRYNTKFLKDFTFDGSFGGSRMANNYDKQELRADKLRVPGDYSFSNAKNGVVAYPYLSKYAVNSVYGMGAFSYKNWLFFDFTMRNDWTSTLATPQNKDRVSFFYDSYNLAVALNEVIKMPKAINYWKVRASVATVGSGGTWPYLTAYVYDPQQAYNSGLANPANVANPFLTPEKTRSYEAGTELRMFDNRVTADVSVYRNNSTNQIIPSAPIDPASGYRGAVLNAGEIQNNGVEVALSGVIIKRNKQNPVGWKTNGTFATNRGKVISLAEGLSTHVMSSGPRGTMEARPGGYVGDLYGIGYQRNEEGKIIYENGLPKWTESPILVGNTTPRYRAGWGNEISYKQFRLNFLFDSQFGGVGYSLTHAVLAEEGKLKKTIPGRYNGIIGDGVVVNKDGSYSPNTQIVTDIQSFYSAHYNRENVEANTFKTDFIKLRELRLDYSFKPATLKALRLQRATIGLYGRDLFMITKWPAFDPEFGSLNSDNTVVAGFEVGQFPSTRTLGANLTVSF
ncbi:TonB-linked SusC/RagA family outer membrane protein [Chitinophaga skermanii]|uniref:TonB-linked SusC/RagA family outer membrane protein n=1 Tax=Chitinophaga skermanii TaxID=331697 RepID=A0A327QPR5_9BACT|nr:SusC/RagA family TonB-linked outer membrane protein [Chitinophaga skermanii]RAJ06616.1 TonB-linked SusC/RagA family outer membrane protein [Chitinophaga skermanii]